MFRQRRPLLERIDSSPPAGLICFFALTALLWLGSVGRWPAGISAKAVRWEWFAFVWVTYVVRYFLLRGRQRGWFTGILALGLLIGGLNGWRAVARAGEWSEAVRVALMIVVPALVAACGGEAVAAVWHHLLVRPCPYGFRFDTFSGRRSIADSAVAESGKLALSLGLYGTTGLLSLSRNYVFDAFAYSYVLAAAVVMAYVFTVGGTAGRLWKGVTTELSRLEDTLEASYERFLRPGAQANDFSAQFRLNIAMQEWLKASGRIPMRWESFLLLLAALFSVLLPPYVVCIVSGLRG